MFRSTCSRTVLATSVALCALASMPELAAQPPLESMSAGRHYVLTWPDTVRNLRDARFPNNKYDEHWIAMVFSAVDTRMLIRAPGFTRAPIPIPGGTFTMLDLRGPDLGIAQPAPVEPCRSSRFTVRLDADDPIIVYCFMTTDFGSEGWTPIPVEAWGTEYFVAAHRGEIVADVSTPNFYTLERKRQAAPSEIVIVAAYDNTSVMVFPRGLFADRCQPGSITLNAGEVYLLESHVDTSAAGAETLQQDFAGSRIVSDKPIGVMSGNTRAQAVDEIFGIAGNAMKNLMIEWLSPVDQHGTEFVYMPTWDSRRPTGLPDEKVEEKRRSEVVRAYGTHAGTTSGTFNNGSGEVAYQGEVENGSAIEIRHIPDRAVVHRTSRHAQAMMSSVGYAYLRYVGNGYPGYQPRGFGAWGGYMVELIPRERWTTFAPLYAPAAPSILDHYVNVVTDTASASRICLRDGSRFQFSRRIEGTDLIWGSMVLRRGVTDWIEGRNGARFGGFVYGTLANGGSEEFRPGAARSPDDPPPTGVRPPDGNDRLMHPAEYEEYLGIAYGYPLASPHWSVAPHDSITVRSTNHGCGDIELEIALVNPSPIGLRTIELAKGAVNTRLVVSTPEIISGSPGATVRLEPIDRTLGACASVVITDRTGYVVTVPYAQPAEKVDFDVEGVIEFGTLTTSQSARFEVPITNRSNTPTTVRSIGAFNATLFAVATDLALPATLAPGATLTATVTARPAGFRGSIVDSLTVRLECASVSHQIRLYAISPCIEIGDLEFGRVQEGRAKSGEFMIRNRSNDTTTLCANPATVVSWSDEHFLIVEAELSRIAGLRLLPGASTLVSVTFSGGEPGTYRATSWVRSNAIDECADSSVWSVTVEPVSAAPEMAIGTDRQLILSPNPADAGTIIVIRLPAALADRGINAAPRLVIHDALGRAMDVRPSEWEYHGGGVRWNTAGCPSGVYLVTVLVGGEVAAGRMVLRR